jgi:hypothetical protein
MKLGERLRPSDWERARVLRWFEIVMAEPISVPSGHGGPAYRERLRQFEARYAQLEAELPTPERNA